jgi:hypothetical protein
MGTVANPLYQNLVPGSVPSNPTGNQVSLPSATGPSGLVPSASPSTTAPSNPNPFSSGVPPTFGANTGAYAPTSLTTPVPGQPTTNVGQAAQSPIGGMNTMSPKDLSRLFDSLKKSYGDGPAHLILNFLTSGAGFNQQAINNLLAALQPGIERGTQSLMEEFSASGNRFGSGAEIGLADYLSQVQLNEGQLETKMYEDAVNRYMDVVLGTGQQAAQTKANSPSFFDTLLSGIGLAGAGGQGLSSAISTISPAADTSWLDAIAGAAAAI